MDETDSRASSATVCVMALPYLLTTPSGHTPPPRTQNEHGWGVLFLLPRESKNFYCGKTLPPFHPSIPRHGTLDTLATIVSVTTLHLLYLLSGTLRRLIDLSE